MNKTRNSSELLESIVKVEAKEFQTIEQHLQPAEVGSELDPLDLPVRKEPESVQDEHGSKLDSFSSETKV